MRITLTLACALVFADAALAQPDQRIVPGELIGAVRLGMHEDELVAARGHANRLDYLSEQVGNRIVLNRILTYNAPRLMEVHVSARSERVTDVATEDASLVTDQGIRIGSLTSDVVGAYGADYEEIVGTDYRGRHEVVMRYRRLGLHFGVRNGEVFRIGVTRPQ
jgi:hypothetical protein